MASKNKKTQDELALAGEETAPAPGETQELIPGEGEHVEAAVEDTKPEPAPVIINIADRYGRLRQCAEADLPYFQLRGFKKV